MNRKTTLVVAALAGIITGLLSTYPFPLGPTPSFIIWSAVGLVLGFFFTEKNVAWSGALYGLFLSISFLYSRFGGTTDKLLGYTFLVAGLTVFGVVAGIAIVFIGSKLRALARPRSRV